MKMRSVLLVVLALIIAILQTTQTEAAAYVVGDTLGWQNPPNSTYYESWASTRNFTTGDTLTFNFATGSHDVATVTADAYSSCNTANPLNTMNNGPAIITLNTTGMHYYICTFSGHCTIGQKLAINVGGTNSSTPSPPGTTASPPPPPPPPAGSDSSTIVVSVAMMLMSIAIGFMC